MQKIVTKAFKIINPINNFFNELIYLIISDLSLFPLLIFLNILSKFSSFSEKNPNKYEIIPLTYEIYTKWFNLLRINE